MVAEYAIRKKTKHQDFCVKKGANEKYLKTLLCNK
jgi:hypothetical protein